MDGLPQREDECSSLGLREATTIFPILLRQLKRHQSTLPRFITFPVIDHQYVACTQLTEPS